MKYIIINLLLLSMATTITAQEKTELNVQELLETKNFIFKAESVNPARGRLRQLTSEYDVVVKPDTVVSFLPYFGRAYTAPINPSEAGLKFTATSFDYSLNKGKKQRWEVAIKPNDAQDVQALYFTIFNNGKATLRVNSNNRESITFNGYIIEGKAGKKGF